MAYAGHSKRNNTLKKVGKTAKMVGYDLPKELVKRVFTNRNITASFPKMKRK